METEVFNALLRSIENNSFGEAQLKSLREEEKGLSNDQVLRFIYALLMNGKTYLYNSVLARQKLDITTIKLESSVEPKSQDLLKNLVKQDFSQYGRYSRFSLGFLVGLSMLFLHIPLIIMELRNEKWDRKIADFYASKPLTAALSEIEQTFKAAVQDSAIEARLIGYSNFIGYSTWFEWGQETFIHLIDSIENLEKENLNLEENLKKKELSTDQIAFLQELKEGLIQYAQNPSLLASNELKEKLESHIKNLPEDSAKILNKYKATLEKALTWVKNQEIDIFVTKQKIVFPYFGVRQKHKELLASGKLKDEEKEFVRNLEDDLIRYGNYPNNKLLQEIKAKVTQEKVIQESNKLNLNPVFKNNLQGVLGWIEIQEEHIKDNKQAFKKLSATYHKLQEHGELMLPLYQGFDVRSQGGMCFGYVAAWAKGLLESEDQKEGEDQKSVFGTKPHKMPLFKLADYSEVKLTSSELNHVFFVTPTIANLQMIQLDTVKLSHAISPTKQITHDKSILSQKIPRSYTKNTFADNLIKQAELDSNPNKVYSILLNKTGGGGHVVGMWRTREGAYHFLDANYGWFRCKDEDEFKKWFDDYFHRVGYSIRYPEYQIVSYYKTPATPATFSETINDWFKAAIALKNAIISWLTPEEPPQMPPEPPPPEEPSITEEGDLPANPETNSEGSQQTHSLGVKALALEVPKKPHTGELRSGTRLDVDSLVDKPIASKQILEKKADDFSRPVFHNASAKSENKKEHIELPSEKNEKQIEPPTPNADSKSR